MCNNAFDKKLILSNLKNLKPLSPVTKQLIYVNQHLPKPLLDQKLFYMDQFKAAKNEGKSCRWKIEYETAGYSLYINNQLVTI